MAFFKRGGRDRKGGKGGGDGESARRGGPEDRDDEATRPVGIVSGVLSPPSGGDGSGETLFGDVVARRFGPRTEAPIGRDDHGRPLPPRYSGDAAASPSGESPPDSASASKTTGPSGSAGAGAREASTRERNASTRARDATGTVAPLFPDQPDTPALEVDPMAHIGRATTITGNIVAEEDLEIQGTVEGAVRLANHQVTVGAEGHVKASVEAEIVMVYGRITGDVVASDLVEIEKGGIVGGDVKAPRIIMHDGAIVVGRLDMSASLPNGGKFASARSEALLTGEALESDAATPSLASISSISEARGDADAREASGARAEAERRDVDEDDSPRG